MLLDIAAPILISALIFFVFYRRIRRLFGRQKLSYPRVAIRIVFAGAIAVIFALMPTAPLVIRLLGVAAGLALALGSVIQTETERVDGDWYYQSNPVYGLIVVALLLGRIVSRFIGFGGFESFSGSGWADGAPSMNDPVRRVLLLSIVTFYAVYNIGILFRCRIRGSRQAN